MMASAVKPFVFEPIRNGVRGVTSGRREPNVQAARVD
jgi:hypothetical protein